MAPDIWLLGVSLAAGLGAARLTRAPGAAHVVGPIVATVVAGHVATSAMRRLRGSVLTAAVVGVAALALSTLWGQLSSATRDGLPDITTWHLLVARVSEAGATIRSNPTPVPATAGVVLCIATGAGLVAVLGRALWAWVEGRAARPLMALVPLVPSLGLFCYAALLSSEVDRLAGAIAFLVTTLGFVVSADHGAIGAGARTMAWHTGGGQRATPARGAASPAAGGAAAGGAAAGGARRPARHGDDAGPGSSPRGDRRRGVASATGVVPSVLGAALAVVAPLAVSPAFTALTVNALPFSQSGQGLSVGGAGPRTSDANGGGGGTGAQAQGNGALGVQGSASNGGGTPGVRTIDLVDNLQAVLTDRSGEVMFTARTPHATYWQVAVLTRFDGDAWLPDPTTESAAQAIAQPPRRAVAGLPALPEPKAKSTYRASVTVANLESTLLPLPPTTTSVGKAATLVPGFGAVQAVESAPGERYRAVVRVPVKPGAAASDRGTSSGSLAPYLQLPAIDHRITQLAHHIVAHAHGPAAKAAALARWFDSGRFHYTLTPPANSGSDPLASFLFDTRAGFCQQFAGAYAVLARLDGLPTRVAVGFTTGTTRGKGRYQVTGADAHVWPEVYLGPKVGWTSYEPTPATTGEPPGFGVASGSRTGARIQSSSRTAATSSTLTPGEHSLLPRRPVPSSVPLAFGGRTGGRQRGAAGGPGAWVVVALVAGAGLVVAGAVLALRRGWWPRAAVIRWRAARRRRRRSGDPRAEVLAQWREAAAALDHLRLGRRPGETVTEHADRLTRLADAGWLDAPVPTATRAGGAATAATAYARLAALADRAAYAPDPCAPEDAVESERLGDAVRAGLARAPSSRNTPVPV